MLLVSTSAAVAVSIFNLFSRRCVGRSRVPVKISKSVIAASVRRTIRFLTGRTSKYFRLGPNTEFIPKKYVHSMLCLGRISNQTRWKNFFSHLSNFRWSCLGHAFAQSIDSGRWFASSFWSLFWTPIFVLLAGG